MIACFDRQRDITIYFDNPEEIRQLAERILNGVIINSEKPKQQGKAYVSFRPEKVRELRRAGVGVVDSWNKSQEFEVFLDKDIFEELKTRGISGLRYNSAGSKIHLYDKTRISWLELQTAEHLEFYRDNREKLRPELG